MPLHPGGYQGTGFLEDGSRDPNAPVVSKTLQDLIDKYADNPAFERVLKALKLQGINPGGPGFQALKNIVRPVIGAGSAAAGGVFGATGLLSLPGDTASTGAPNIGPENEYGPFAAGGPFSGVTDFLRDTGIDTFGGGVETFPSTSDFDAQLSDLQARSQANARQSARRNDPRASRDEREPAPRPRTPNPTLSPVPFRPTRGARPE